MQFVKLASSYYLDPAVITLSEAAEIAFVRSLAYAGGAESSGFIPEQALPMLMRRYAPARARSIAAELVTAQLWVAVPGGWLLRTWDKHQQELEALLQRKRSDADRQRRHRAKVKEVDASRDTGRDMSRDASREPIRDPFRASARANARESEVEIEEELDQDLDGLTVVCRLTSRNASATTTTELRDRWQALAGPHADLEAEAVAFLDHNAGVELLNPAGAWRGWLQAAAKRTKPTPIPGTPTCPVHPGQPTGSRACPRCATEAAPSPGLRALRGAG